MGREKAFCLHCEHKLAVGVPFCPQCDQPTEWASVDDRRAWEVRQWRRHAGKSPESAPRPVVTAAPLPRPEAAERHCCSDHHLEERRSVPKPAASPPPAPAPARQGLTIPGPAARAAAGRVPARPTVAPEPVAPSAFSFPRNGPPSAPPQKSPAPEPAAVPSEGAADRRNDDGESPRVAEPAVQPAEPKAKPTKAAAKPKAKQQRSPTQAALLRQTVALLAELNGRIADIEDMVSAIRSSRPDPLRKRLRRWNSRLQRRDQSDAPSTNSHRS